MNSQYKYGLPLWVLALLSAFALQGCVTTQGGQGAILRAKDKVAPALVHIRPVKEVYTSGKRQEMLVTGSGFIISPDGYVVTNEHVAGDSTLVYCVLSSKEEVEAKVIGVDPFTDIALLKLDVGHALPYVHMGSSARLESGQTVLALGSPHGLARSVSQGIVSVTDRYLDSGGSMRAPYNNFIQTDAAINPGNSGGPLVDIHGRVIGVNSRVLRGAENVGFAIPVDIVKDVVADLKADGLVSRAWFGIDLQEMLAYSEETTNEGVVIADIDPLSPAAEAKASPGDIIIAVNGQSVHARFEEDLPALRYLMAKLPIGEPATITVTRSGESVDLTVVPELKSALKGDEFEFKEWGFTARELTPEIVRRAQLARRQGIYVSGVQVGGVAHKARLSQGDIVLRVDDTEIADLASFQKIYQERIDSEQKLTLLFVKKGALTRYVIVKQEENGEGDEE